MIFQRSTAVPMSIYDNIAYGLRLGSQRCPENQITSRVEMVLQGAGLWDEVKDKLHKSGLSLSGGQQQRMCIARAVAVNPWTHNLQQAMRVSDYTAFLNMNPETRAGQLV